MVSYDAVAFVKTIVYERTLLTEIRSSSDQGNTLFKEQWSSSDQGYVFNTNRTDNS